MIVVMRDEIGNPTTLSLHTTSYPQITLILLINLCNLWIPIS